MRFLHTLLALATLSSIADAGPFRHRFRTRTVTTTTTDTFSRAVVAGPLHGDALAEVNAARAMRGLPPYLRDEGLTVGALTVARFRAANGIGGHTGNDFAGLPAGVGASAAGCAAWPVGLGWGACTTYERWTYAGAAWAIGADGRRYMHLFVR